MKLWHSVIIAVGIIVGLVAHGMIRAWPEQERQRRGYEMQLRMLEVMPREIAVGDAKVLYLPRISYRNLSIDVNYEFYTYVDGELKQVKMTKDRNPTIQY